MCLEWQPLIVHSGGWISFWYVMCDLIISIWLHVLQLLTVVLASRFATNSASNYWRNLQTLKGPFFPKFGPMLHMFFYVFHGSSNWPCLLMVVMWSYTWSKFSLGFIFVWTYMFYVFSNWVLGAGQTWAPMGSSLMGLGFESPSSYIFRFKCLYDF